MEWPPKPESKRLEELRARLARTSTVKLEMALAAGRRALASYEKAIPHKRNPKGDREAAERLRVEIGALEAEVARRRAAPPPPPGT
jgi:hypothetical protein